MDNQIIYKVLFIGVLCKKTKFLLFYFIKLNQRKIIIKLKINSK